MDNKTHQPDVSFVSYVVASLVKDSNLTTFNVERRVDEKGVLLTIKIDGQYMGRVIGKGGETVNAIRALLHALGSSNGAHYSLKVEKR